MKIRNVYLALKDQLPIRRLLRNLRLGNLKGLFHVRSHLLHNGSPKITYNTKVSAVKAATEMTAKKGVRFGSWKCVHCDGYHIGKNRSTLKQD